MTKTNCRTCNNTGKIQTGEPPFPYYIVCFCINPDNKEYVESVLKACPDIALFNSSKE